jgi:hypothetical protein
MSPPTSTQLASKEGRMALAINSYKSGSFTSIREAANTYEVSHTTLRARLQGRVPRQEIRSANLKLTDTEEQTLVNWILSMDGRGLPVRIASIRDMANLLLQKRTGTDASSTRTVGPRWAYNFVRRHDSLRTRYNRKYDYKRALCEDPKAIRDWFRLVQNTVTKYGIQEEDIYNFDETGFQMGVITTAKVVTGSERSLRPVTIQPGNREWVTAIECTSASGWAVPPMIIFDGKVHISSWYTDELPYDWTIAVSDNGWTNDSLGLNWLTDVFEKHTKDRTKGVYRLLILDGHGSHSTPEFDLFCSEHSIITLCMPPHSSHLLQPLDVSCFAVLKRSYGRQIEDLMRVGVNHIDKSDFLPAYLTARTEALTSNTVRSGFAAAGLVPYDPERVLSKLNSYLRTPTPPPPPTTEQAPWVPETPHNIQELEFQAKAIGDFVQRHTAGSSSPTDRAVRQLVKGCQMAMHSAVLLADENKRLRTANERQIKKRAVRREYIAKGGVLTVQEGLNRSAIVNIEPMDQFTGGVEEQRIRAPRTCSMCKSPEHTARTCPLRFVSN